MEKLLLKKCEVGDVPLIHRLAHEIWPPTFGDILSPTQMTYMLDMMYSEESLYKQMEDGVEFYLAVLGGESVGYCGIQHYEQITKLHKLYLLPNCQGHGVGKAMMNHVVEQARANGSAVLTLNVNRYNKAVDFYKYYGYTIVKTEDIDIGNGYLMEDYKMDYKLDDVVDQ